MAEKKWTPEQQNAIEARGGTVLVSAAAGSGKTAVLVERVLGYITDLEHPVDADRFLVVTFSNAAAAEMKQRILARLGELVAANPGNAGLRRQQLLAARAQISTIHSFCLELIRSNFQSLGIPADVRTADEKELQLMRIDCAREVIEQFHAGEQAQTFGQLVELLSTGRDDKRVFDTLFSLYDFVRAHPFYRDWLDDKLALYNPGVAVQDSVWGQCILRYAADTLAHVCALARQAIALMRDDEAMQKAYYDAFAGDLRQAEHALALARARDWDALYAAIGAFTHAKLGPLKGDSMEKAAAQALRNGIKKAVEGLRERQLCATAEQFADDLAFLRPMVEVLFALVRAFDEAFTQAKLQKSLMDFSDMEHYAIALLVKCVGAGFSRTPLAQSVAARFEEVLVDEFQDTNAAQELIFQAVSREQSNLFMVGDVKQSIYRFRQAMPELFLEKQKRFAPYDGHSFPARIILGKNFRSAPGVTGAINFFFRQLMSEALGEVDYNDEHELTAGATFPEGITGGCEIDLLDVTEYAGERTKTAVEAAHVAARIAKLLREGYLVADGEKTRPVTPSDICLLLRSPSGKAQIYREALEAAGVPVWAEPKNSFLASKEIAPVIALLRVLDNPLRDVDLTATMLSSLFGFTADEMVRIRLTRRRGALWLAVQAHADAGDAHCAAFIAQIQSLRAFAVSATADEVIRHIYEQTDYLGKVQVMRRGEMRRANLLLLVRYAGDYHASGYKGLSGFVGFIDRLCERGGDLVPASSASEQAQVVRIMSIHRSKGLEFPVVFLCDCAKDFNRKDLNASTLLHSELGFACARRDFERMQQFTTVPMQAVRLELERAMLSEELRVLYVALTRAKQQLVIVGTLTKARERLAKLVCEADEWGRLPAYQVRAANCSLDWMLMAAAHHPALAEEIAAMGTSPDVLACDAPLSLCITDVKDDASETTPETAQILPAPDPVLVAELERRLAFSYPYTSETRIPTKLAVSEIAKGELAKRYRFARRPVFLQQDGLTGAQKGNVLHTFMQFADYHAASRDVRGEIERLRRKGFLTGQEADAVDEKKLRAFFQSSLASRIFASKRIWRELRFLSEAGNDILEPYTDILKNTGNRVAIQGVADCVFEEDGQAVIVDYKSDHVKRAEDLIERYAVQLAIYREVLESALGMPVKECIIYSFALSCEITLSKDANTVTSGRVNE